MKCPYCGNTVSKVIDSRPTENNEAIRRRRECTGCYSRYTTYEKIELSPLVVIKSNNKREVFDPTKLLKSMLQAFDKRKVSIDQLQDIVSKIELTLHHANKKEITSEQIAHMVMDEMKQVDEVAYIRFASVYKNFTTINAFVNALNKMQKETLSGDE